MTYLHLLLLASLLSLASCNCNNPLGKAQLIDLADSPSSRSGTCATEVLDGESCCSQDYHDEAGDRLEELYDKYKSNADYIVALAGAINDVLDDVYDQIADDYEKYTGEELEYSRDDDEDDPEVYYIKNGEWKDMVESFATEMQKCHQKMFDLAATFSCLACDPDWKDYMEEEDDYVFVGFDYDSYEEGEEACADFEEAFAILLTKYSTGALVVMAIETLNFNFDEDELDDVVVDYLDEDDYEAEDDWEKGDLEVVGSFIGDGVMLSLGIFGPNVYYLMLFPNTMYTVVEEMIAYGNGDENIFQEDTRLLSQKNSGRRARQLRASRVFILGFDEDAGLPDAFEISATLDISPTVEELHGGRTTLGLILLMAVMLMNWFQRSS